MKSVQRILLVGCAGLLGLAQEDRTERMRRRWEDFYQRRAFPRESIPAGARARAIQEMNRMVERERALARQKGVAASPERWTPIGPQPTNVGPTAGTFPYSSGRVSALAVDPRNPDVAYLGGAHGGVWKTTDGGRNWTSLTDSQISLATGSIALDPRNPDIVYAGTGEQNFSGDSYYGAGILKSADRGLSWTHLPGPFVGPFTAGTGAGGARIGAISIHPVRSEVLLAGVQRTPTASAGIFRSTDGGVTWTNVLAGASGTAVFFDPKNGDVAYAALGDPNTNPRNGAYKSTDGGLTWNTASGTGALSLPATFVGRIAMAGSASNPSVIYAGIHSVQPGANDGLRGLFKSDDGAQTWRQLAAPDYCQPQCWYNNVLAVSPVDPNLVVAAGFTIYRSVNGGQSWAVTSVGPSGAATHVDHHALAFSADGTRVYNGNDGGVWSSPNLASAAINWTNLNATLSLTQFNWGISIHPRDVNIGYGGTQDNGTQRYSGKPAWDAFVGGDGGATAIDPLDPSTVYGGFFGLSLHKTSASANFSASMSISHGIDQRDRSPFYPTLSMDPSNPLKLYFGTYRVYRTTDGAGVWRPISPDLSLVAERPNERSVVTTIAVAPGDTNVLYAGTGNGRVHVSTNAGADWTDITGTLPLRAVTRVAVDPVHAAIAYVAFSGFFGFGTDNQGHIFKTVDFGQTWTDISTNLPNNPVNDVLIDPDLIDNIYAATDIGVFRTASGGDSWSTLSSGLPRVTVEGLAFHRPSRTLRAATHGRGVWDLQLPLLEASRAPVIDSVSPPALTVTVNGANFFPGSIARWNGYDRPTAFVSSRTLLMTLSAVDLSKAGRNALLVFNRAGGQGNSNLVSFDVGPAPGFAASGLVSAASRGVSGVLVPGSFSSLYGTNLAAETVLAADNTAMPTTALPSSLGGVVVNVDGDPAPLLFVSPTQINFQAPWFLRFYSRAILTVTNGFRKTSVPVDIVPYLPAIFTLDWSGGGQGLINVAGTDGALAAPEGTAERARPAQRGESVEIFCSGLGPVSRTPGDGNLSPGPPLAITRLPEVTIGGVPATVAFSGLTPGRVGIYQVTVQVPEGVPAGDSVPVSLTIANVGSNTVTIAVR